MPDTTRTTTGIALAIAATALQLLCPRGIEAQASYPASARALAPASTISSTASLSTPGVGASTPGTAPTRSVRATAVWELPDVTTPPRAWSVIDVARSIARHYPAEARRQERRGRVELEMIIGADGLVEPGSITLIRASSDDFVEPAKRVAAELRFTPARHERGVVRARVVVPVGFEP